MGISPAHFNGAAGGTIFPATGACSDVWWQYSWQTADRVSREDLARAINSAEQEVADFLGYWPGPKWISNEMHLYERPYRRNAYGDGLNVRGMRKSIIADWGKFIEAGQRAVSLVGTATTAGGTLVYSDDDGDSYDETATITLATALTEECEIKAYFPGHAGDQLWEIRPARSVTLSGGNVILVYYSWQLLDPDLWEVFPTADGLTAIDLEDSANYLASVDVYREFTDFAVKSAEFYWEPKAFNIFPVDCKTCGGTGCPACSLTVQSGCLHVRDVPGGILVPQPATYDETEAQWNQVTFTVCREPDQIKVWYRAGDLDQRYLAGYTCDPLSHYWAEVIAWLAVARLERNFCACSNLTALVNDLRRDMSINPRDGETRIVSPEDLANPFGTRMGEIKAWRRLRAFSRRRAKVAVF
jgi:hypothetical protein